MIPTEKFDLIVKFEEDKAPTDLNEYMAMKKLEDKLKNHDPRFYLKESEFYNVFLVELMEKNLNTALKLAETSLKKNFEILPIETVVPTRPKEILKEIINTSKDKIKDGETFTIKCNIRGSRYIKTREEFINHLYTEIEKTNRKPDENHPDWIIHIEVVGENTGISVLKQI